MNKDDGEWVTAIIIPFSVYWFKYAISSTLVEL
jgi:hypothetical protein